MEHQLIMKTCISSPCISLVGSRHDSARDPLLLTSAFKAEPCVLLLTPLTFVLNVIPSPSPPPPHLLSLKAWANEEARIGTDESREAARSLFRRCVGIAPHSLHALQVRRREEKRRAENGVCLSVERERTVYHAHPSAIVHIPRSVCHFFVHQ